MSKTYKEHMQVVIDAAKRRQVGMIDGWNIGYFTEGGTYMIASDAKTTDSGSSRDLIAILPGRILNTTRVIPVWIAVNSDLIEALRKELDK